MELVRHHYIGASWIRDGRGERFAHLDRAHSDQSVSEHDRLGRVFHATHPAPTPELSPRRHTLSLPGFQRRRRFPRAAQRALFPISQPGGSCSSRSATPAVPMALVYWSDAVKNHTEVSNVPIEQLDWGRLPDPADADGGRVHYEMQNSASSGWHRPLATILSARRKRRARARCSREFFRATQSAPGSLTTQLSRLCTWKGCSWTRSAARVSPAAASKIPERQALLFGTWSPRRIRRCRVGRCAERGISTRADVLSRVAVIVAAGSAGPDVRECLGPEACAGDRLKDLTLLPEAAARCPPCSGRADRGRVGFHLSVPRWLVIGHGPSRCRVHPVQVASSRSLRP